MLSVDERGDRDGKLTEWQLFPHLYTLKLALGQTVKETHLAYLGK